MVEITQNNSYTIAIRDHKIIRYPDVIENDKGRARGRRVGCANRLRRHALSSWDDHCHNRASVFIAASNREVIGEGAICRPFLVSSKDSQIEFPLKLHLWAYTPFCIGVERD